jgi:hypothetical protein
MKNLERMREYGRMYYKQYYEKNKEKMNLRVKIYKQNNLEQSRKSVRIDYMNKKNQLYNILGGARCSNPKCLVPGGCVDIRCLQFDHINGGGVKDAHEKGGHGKSIVYYYVAHPEEAKQKLQVLCANCNWIKRATRGENRYKFVNPEVTN